VRDGERHTPASGSDGTGTGANADTGTAGVIGETAETADAA
jgi:hypothetical protein